MSSSFLRPNTLISLIKSNGCRVELIRIKWWPLALTAINTEITHPTFYVRKLNPAANMSFLLTTWKQNQDKTPNYSHSSVFHFSASLSLILFFHHSLITHIILLPSTKMRHQFLCRWELQISFELALEDMGGDRSGRRRRDKLMSTFELAFTRSGRETMLENLKEFQWQIGEF